LSWLGNPQAVVISYRGRRPSDKQYLSMESLTSWKSPWHRASSAAGGANFEKLREPGRSFALTGFLDGPAATHLRDVRSESGLTMVAATAAARRR